VGLELENVTPNEAKYIRILRFGVRRGVDAYEGHIYARYGECSRKNPLAMDRRRDGVMCCVGAPRRSCDLACTICPDG
jgi:hypothetical protein